jgi:hypothetical protein
MTKESKFHHSCSANQQNVTLHVKHDHPGLIKMSAFVWSMTRWYKIHATAGSYVTSLGGLNVAIHDVMMV